MNAANLISQPRDFIYESGYLIVSEQLSGAVAAFGEPLLHFLIKLGPVRYSLRHCLFILNH